MVRRHFAITRRPLALSGHGFDQPPGRVGQSRLELPFRPGGAAVPAQVAHGPLHGVAKPAAQVPRLPPQRGLQLPRGLRFAEHPDHLQQRLRDRAVFGRHVGGDIFCDGANELATHACLARDPAAGGLGDPLLCSPGEKSIHRHPRARERSAHHRAGGLESDPHGSRLRARGLRGRSIPPPRLAQS